ncbi:hypothetical protein BV898_17040 [Hypsibius exemplaris]|uniref:C3H1-type domain-containing protein n=1 Tax=Hypsibius exemplaris TaxID=2072580 RepID=A0A9X6NH94_HYPEX|nr:hypothetical protein BV898_17040 [Hypsibius exemplaris]
MSEEREDLAMEDSLPERDILTQEEAKEEEEEDGTAADSPASEIPAVAAKKNGKNHSASDEEGEASDDGEIKDENGKADSGEEGELEDGEVDEDEDGERKSKDQLCKYFYKGQCTWGGQCRFIHPGYVDKGDYNMFAGSKPKPAPSAEPPVKPAPPAEAPRPRSPPPPRMNSLLGHPPAALLRLPIIPPDFFPPIPEPPRRETMWEKGVKQARHLAQAAAKKRDAMEDKMHGLADRFDPQFDETARFPPIRHINHANNGFIPDEPPFPFNPMEQRRTFPVFSVRNPAEFEQVAMSREREMRRQKNFMEQQQQLQFARINEQQNRNVTNSNNSFDRRRSPPPNDLRRSLNDARSSQRSQRPADEWQDPWMRSRSPIRGNNNNNNPRSSDRWVRKSISPRGSRSPKSRSRSVSKISRTSRISEVSQPRKRSSRRSSRSPVQRPQSNRLPSGSPISSNRSPSRGGSRSPSPALLPRQERSSPVSSRAASDRRRKFSGGGNSSHHSETHQSSKRVDREGSPISSASSGRGDRDDDEDGPRTPPPDDQDEDSTADESRESYGQGQKRRLHSGSPISPEHSDDNMRRSASPAEPAMDEPRSKRLKKTHKPVKMMLNLKTDRRNALSALGADGDDDEENVELSGSIEPELPTTLKHSSSVDLDRSSPLSDEGSSPHRSAAAAGSNNPPDSSDKQAKRIELLAQLRAVEEAIARKKATKTGD